MLKTDSTAIMIPAYKYKLTYWLEVPYISNTPFTIEPKVNVAMDMSSKSSDIFDMSRFNRFNK